MFATWSWGACCTFISQKGHWPLYCKKQVLLLGKAFICFFFSSSMFEVTLNFQFGFRLESKSEFFFSRESKGTFGLIQWRHSCFGSNTSHVLCLSGWSSLCFGLGFFFFSNLENVCLKSYIRGVGGGGATLGHLSSSRRGMQRDKETHMDMIPCDRQKFIPEVVTVRIPPTGRIWFSNCLLSCSKLSVLVYPLTFLVVR